ncbi:MAG: TlpA disulfide reductase family protein [Pseudomonadota bacterium]
MTQKIILYTMVLVIAGTAGFGSSYFLAGNQQVPDIAKPVSLMQQASVAASGATSAVVDFTMPNLDGSDSRLSDWAGKPRLINFWATWCAPCRREIPLLKDLQDAQVPDGLQVIGVAFDELAAVTDYAVEADFNYPILVGEQEAIGAAAAFDIELIALPFTLIVTADGRLLNAHVGEVDEGEADEIIRIMNAIETGQMDFETAKAALAK